MPSAITHDIFARALLGRLARGRSRLFAQGAMMRLGAQGPDFLFFHEVFRLGRRDNLKGVGSRLHCLERDELPRLLLREADAQPLARDALRAYALGFFSHMELDELVHPYVNARVAAVAAGGGPVESPRVCVHRGIETALDILLLRREGEPQPRQYELWSALGVGPATIGALCGALARALAELGMPADARQLAEAFRHMMSGLRLVTSRFAGGALHAAERLVGSPPELSCMFYEQCDPRSFDYLNTRGDAWTRHDGSTTRMGFFMALDGALESCSERAKAFLW